MCGPWLIKKFYKQKMAQWAFIAFRKTLKPHNMCKGFKATIIWPFNPCVIANKMHSNETFVEIKTPNI